MTPARRNGAIAARSAAHANTYVVCLDCGKEFSYDWKTMRVGAPIAAHVTAPPVVSAPAAVPQAQAQAQPMYR